MLLLAEAEKRYETVIQEMYKALLYISNKRRHLGSTGELICLDYITMLKRQRGFRKLALSLGNDENEPKRHQTGCLGPAFPGCISDLQNARGGAFCAHHEFEFGSKCRVVGCSNDIIEPTEACQDHASQWNTCEPQLFGHIRQELDMFVRV